MGLGITLIIKVKFMPAVVLALILGAAIGEIIYLEKFIGKLAGSTRGVIDRYLPSNSGLGQAEFTERFVAILVL
ncbi:DUF554 family protein, partial [Burkholderia sp. SIMBA_052]